MGIMNEKEIIDIFSSVPIKDYIKNKGIDDLNLKIESIDGNNAVISMMDSNSEINFSKPIGFLYVEKGVFDNIPTYAYSIDQFEEDRPADESLVNFGTIKVISDDIDKLYVLTNNSNQKESIEISYLINGMLVLRNLTGRKDFNKVFNEEITKLTESTINGSISYLESLMVMRKLYESYEAYLKRKETNIKLTK